MFELLTLKGALNLWTTDLMEEYFFSSLAESPGSCSPIVIMHCEFSSKRAPAM